MRRPRPSLSLAVAQPPCVAHDVAANARTHAAVVRAARARVVVFPELSLSGYEMDAAAITTDDARLGPLIEACAATGTLALVGAPLEAQPGRAHIAMLAVDGSGARVAYRKLYVADSEAGRFGAGDAPARLDVDGWRLGLGICRDTGIRQHVLDTVALGIDAYVAGTLMFPEETAIQNERGCRIAREHHVWTALASFAGPTGGGYSASAGCSGIWAPDGRLVAQTGPQPGGIACATLV
jgi:predicted amidohydrolase